MPEPIILASQSEIRQSLLSNSGIVFEAIAARIDEEMIRESLIAEGASPRDIADALAEMKSRKVSEKHPEAFVIGCDQLIDFDGQIVGKPLDQDDLRMKIRRMRGRQHDLLSAVVVYQKGQPVWRHIGRVRMTMHDVSDKYLDNYIRHHWDHARHVAGGYLLEREGVRLFSNIAGDYFTVLGLPLVELLTYLGQRGVIET